MNACGGVVERERKKNIGAVLNMVLICVILNELKFKYEVNKMSEKN